MWCQCMNMNLEKWDNGWTWRSETMGELGEVWRWMNLEKWDNGWTWRSETMGELGEVRRWVNLEKWDNVWARGKFGWWEWMMNSWKWDNGWTQGRLTKAHFRRGLRVEFPRSQFGLIWSKLNPWSWTIPWSQPNWFCLQNKCHVSLAWICHFLVFEASSKGCGDQF